MGYKWPKEVKFNLVVMISVVVVVMTKNAILDGCSTVDSKLDYDGIRWYSMVFDGIRWYSMVLHGTRWYFAIE